jgi:hypothetical protein
VASALPDQPGVELPVPVLSGAVVHMERE